MSRYTRLETAVMAALAHDLRKQIPDLAGQFEEARPGLRRNTAFGWYVETIVDRARPLPASGPSGHFGTVHAMLPGLSESVAFQVEVMNGRLLALHGDSYGQDTRAIDLAAVVPTEIFTIDADGRSVPYQPATGYRADSPLRVLQRNTDPESAPPPEPPPEPPRLVNVGPLQRVQDVGRPPETARPEPRKPETRRPAPGPTSLPAPDDNLDALGDHASLLIGVWLAIGAVAILAVLLFDAPVFVSLFIAFFIGRAVKNPKALDLIARALREMKAQQGPSRS